MNRATTKFRLFQQPLQGCHTEGNTYEEAMVNIQDAIKLYLEDLVKDNESIPKDTWESFATVRVAI